MEKLTAIAELLTENNRLLAALLKELQSTPKDEAPQVPVAGYLWDLIERSPGYAVPRHHVYKAVSDYQSNNKLHVDSRIVLYSQLRRLGIKETRTKEGRYFVGIRLL